MTGRSLTAMMDEDDIDGDEELQRHIPQGNSPYRRGLWAEAYEWVCQLLSVFGDIQEIRFKGLKREGGLQLNNWLWGMEGAVRRLIIAAALALDPQDFRKPKTKPTTHTIPPKPSRRLPIFRVFCLRGRASSPPPQRQSQAIATTTGPRPYGHIPYPADPLLRLGEPRKRGQCNSSPRQRNPLDRWVRPSRQDPDYHPRRERDAEGGPFRSARKSDPASPRLRQRKTRESHSPFALPESLPESLHDWRRVHDEWEKIVPAPSLAARIYALQRIVADPEALIARTAQRLQSIRDQIAALIKQALPLLRQPRRDKTKPLSDTAILAARCHGAILRPDTS